MGGFFDSSAGHVVDAHTFTSSTEQVADAHDTPSPKISTEKMMGAHAITASTIPLHEYDLIIQRDGTAVVAISEEEVLDRSKGDGLGKLILVFQTLWFVTQYLGRWIDHLPRSQLEVMTLAYAILAVVVYFLWWHKPLNVRCPIVVSKVHPPPSTAHPPSPSAHPAPSIARYPPTFDHYPGVGLFNYRRLPEPSKTERFQAIMIVAVVAVIFGGVHCLAWNFPFPTSEEKLVWRICAIFVTADPVVLGVICNWGTDYVYMPTPFELLEQGVVGVMISLLTACYVVSRGILFVITLLALRYSPAGVYQTIPWASFIPHLG